MHTTKQIADKIRALACTRAAEKPAEARALTEKAEVYASILEECSLPEAETLLRLWAEPMEAVA